MKKGSFAWAVERMAQRKSVKRKRYSSWIINKDIYPDVKRWYLDADLVECLQIEDYLADDWEEVEKKEDVIPVPENIVFEHRGGTILLRFGNDKLMFADIDGLLITSGCLHEGDMDPHVLVPVEAENGVPKNAKVGDWYFASNEEEPDFSDITKYKLWVEGTEDSKWKYRFVTIDGVIYPSDITRKCWWKVVPKEGTR